ncbi:molybdopterin molybdotransferase MoeA [Herbiconiux sp. KACC 21604]|uniref:molybdopterin molybdotransferase MoeA n=1 Tax=unclassified Herbiconiux TaxID=2618217 RepID=UPI001490BF3D|nr:molybdopterin molybdotransferase MoeA [Herbiconiux sp. SALV-R1]QJU55057.1 molybdopterin molybdotransferase MoeA [Herbiconiux sp. SALV-R1]WPO86198.1 molybdopterin molybdotransferase MoeA [Herbiconiux sp. KACC 21604]
MTRTRPAAPEAPDDQKRATWHEARRLAHEAGACSAAARGPDAREEVPLAQALTRVAALDVVAPTPLPHFASSAMDGWAVAGPGPWRLHPSAAAASSSKLAAGEAVDIVTGALLPEGCDAVLRSENGEVRMLDHAHPVLHRAPWCPDDEPRPGQHVRAAGAEASVGDVLITRGSTLGPVHLAVAAGAGCDVLSVRRPPTVALALTGDEVVTEGLPLPGQVRDSFGPSLPGVVAALGGRVVAADRIGDSAAATAGALGLNVRTPVDGNSFEPQPDIVVTTGGTGSSTADHVRAVLREAGAEVVVDGIDVRPGGPAFLARMPDARWVVGLPGNPLAALLSCITLLQPLVAGMLELPLPTLRAVELGAPVDPARAHTLLRPFTTRPDPARPGGELAFPTPWHGAAMLRGLADAVGVLVVPGAGAEAGQLVPCVPVPW